MNDLEPQQWGHIALTPQDGGYAILAIRREEKRNAMNRQTRQDMLHAMEFARGRYPVVVLTGVGNSFCAGVDMKERAEDVARGDYSASAEWTDVNVAIRQHPSVFIAAVNGIALGGGVTLINVCDLAVACDTVEIGMPEMSFSTYPGMAGPSTQLSLSRKRVAWMMLTTERVKADVAVAWGLLNACVPQSKLMETAQAWATKIASFNPNALAASKQALDQIPAVITDWRQAFQYGELVNAKIQQRNANNNPFTKALPQGKD